MRTAAQKRYAEKNRELLRAKDMRRNHHNPVRDAENKNQRNSILGWRWLGWRRKPSSLYFGLAIVNAEALDNPCFTFIHGGKRCREHLRSPLPCW